MVVTENAGFNAEVQRTAEIYPSIYPSPPAVTEWSRLLLVDVICCIRRRRPWRCLTVHCQWGGRPLWWPSPFTL